MIAQSRGRAKGFPALRSTSALGTLLSGVTREMSTSDQVRPPELHAFVATVERLHREQTVSFVAAGDEKIYAYGGYGFVAIF
jgi:hypothetical protein